MHSPAPFSPGTPVTCIPLPAASTSVSGLHGDPVRRHLRPRLSTTPQLRRLTTRRKERRATFSSHPLTGFKACRKVGGLRAMPARRRRGPCRRACSCACARSCETSNRCDSTQDCVRDFCARPPCSCDVRTVDELHISCCRRLVRGGRVQLHARRQGAPTRRGRGHGGPRRVACRRQSRSVPCSLHPVWASGEARQSAAADKCMRMDTQRPEVQHAGCISGMELNLAVLRAEAWPSGRAFCRAHPDLLLTASTMRLQRSNRRRIKCDS
jgi:hypothetical protein